MKWNKYTISTKNGATEYICDMLIGLGITGMQIDDNLGLTEEERKAQFIDYIPTLSDSDEAFITFYTETKENEEDEMADCYNLTGVGISKQSLKFDDEELLEIIREELIKASKFMDIGSGLITKDVTVDSDWKDNWKQFFKTFLVGNFIIKPLWDKENINNVNNSELEGKNKEEKIIEEAIADDVKTIYIDPGMAFGTGKHETTALCIRELEKYVKEGMSVFDVGCGSAILSIAAKKLGAKNMFLTDIDPEAINVVSHNFEINDIKDIKVYKEFSELKRDKKEERINRHSDSNIIAVKGDLLSDDELSDFAKNNKYDIVVANILADVIIPLSGVVDKYLKTGGIFISSGIIYTRKDEVLNAFKNNNNLEVLDVNRDGDWVMISAKKIK